MRENFAKLFGYKCDILAKMLYINMANSMDHAKIDFLRFMRVFDGFLGDNTKKRNMAAFKLYDIKN